MGPGFVYPLWCLMSLFGLAILLIGYKCKNKVGIVSGLLIITVPALLTILTVYRGIMSNSPEWVFKKAFGQNRRDNIEIIDFKYSASTDSECVFLQLKCDEKTANGLKSPEFKEISFEKFSMRSRNFPEIMPKLKKTDRIYHHSKIGPFGGDCIFVFRPMEEIVYYYSLWIE